MNNNIQKLPGIQKIYTVRCSKLPLNIQAKSLAGVPIGIFTELQNINFVGTPVCQTEDGLENNACFQKTTLSFKTTATIDESHLQAFAFIDNNSDRWLIGTSQSPFPAVKVSTNSGTENGDASISIVEVTLKARKSLIAVSF